MGPNWVEASREALDRAATLAPLLAGATHHRQPETNPHLPAVQSQLGERERARTELLVLAAELKQRVAALDEVFQREAEYDKLCNRALIGSAAVDPEVAELQSKVRAREEVLAMHREVVAEVIVQSGDEWDESNLTQWIVPQ